MKPLILFYSYSGNTRKVAEQIQQITGGDLSEIQTIAPYPGDYNAVVEQAKQEIAAGFAPAIQPLGVDPSGYDTMILGTPVWWYTLAPALKTALEGQDWAGKTIYPFATHGGGPGSTLADLGKACAGATIQPGLDLYFSGAGPRDLVQKLESWLAELQ